EVGILSVALGDSSPLVRGHAAWALGRIARRTGARVAEVLAGRLAVEDVPWVREELVLALGEADGRGRTG
ncbi:MAG: hypothetical protein C4321_04345, partial [Chloroflexota bacterium]